MSGALGGTKVTVADYLTSRLAEKQALHLLAANAQRRSVPSGDATTRTAPAGRTRSSRSRQVRDSGTVERYAPARGRVGRLGCRCRRHLTMGWRYGLLAAWMFAAVVFLIQVWSHIARMDPPTTAAHAVREDSGRKTTDVLVVLAAVASLGAVALLLSSGSSSGKDLQALLSVGSVALAWASVHTMYTTRYARAPGVDHVSIRQLSDGSSDHHRRIWICTGGSGYAREERVEAGSCGGLSKRLFSPFTQVRDLLQAGPTGGPTEGMRSAPYCATIPGVEVH